MTSILRVVDPSLVAPLPLSDVPRTRIAVLRSASEATRLADALLAQDIEAIVEIDDAQHALPGRSLLPGVFALPDSLFAYPLTVPVADQDRAMRILHDIDERRAAPSLPALARGAAVVIALTAAALAVRVPLS